jgi:hypothetical protein
MLSLRTQQLDQKFRGGSALRALPGFQSKDYSFFRNNCQDYCAIVRERFSD